MRSITAKWMALPLVAAGLAMSVTPADALQRMKKKDVAEEATPAPEMSKAFREAAYPLQKAIDAKDYATATTLLPAADAAATTSYERYVVEKFRLSIGLGTKDTAAQYSAIDKILDSGQATPEEAPSLYFYSGNSAYSDGDYEKAAERLSNAVRLGYTKNNAPLMLADSYLNLKRLDEAFQIARETIAAKRAAGEAVPEDWFTRPASAAQAAGRIDALMEFLALRLESYPTASNWRNSTMIYLTTLKPDKSTTLDTLRLMSETGAMQTRAEYFEWAESAADSGLPGEAVRAYDLGVKSGHVPATDQQFANLSKAQQSTTKSDKADLASSGASAASAATGTPARATADAWLGYGDYAKAIPLYRLALEKGGVDADQVNTRLGIASALSGNYDQADAAFSAVTGARTSLARLWMAYVAQKRSETVPAAPMATTSGS